MVRKRADKQKRKRLGNRVFGKGDRKNCRGSGNRGGRGNAGMCKHKGTWAAVYAPGYYGKHGFVNPNSKTMPVSHLFEINRSALLGNIEKKGDAFHFEFKGKVLATGNVTQKLAIKAYKWSKRVEEKLKAAGGSIELLEAKV
jgi:large subunit ribosomal protein L15